MCPKIDCDWVLCSIVPHHSPDTLTEFRREAPEKKRNCKGKETERAKKIKKRREGRWGTELAPMSKGR